MKKILLAVFLITALVACKDDKFPGGNTNKGSGFKRVPPPADAYDGGTENRGAKSRDPFPEGKQNHNCLWCGVQLGSERNPIITLSMDTLASPRLLNENQLCGFKCYNEFKNSYFKTNTDQITHRERGATYRIKISNK